MGRIKSCSLTVNTEIHMPVYLKCQERGEKIILSQRDCYDPIKVLISTLETPVKHLFTYLD